MCDIYATNKQCVLLCWSQAEEVWLWRYVARSWANGLTKIELCLEAKSSAHNPVIRRAVGTKLRLQGLHTRPCKYVLGHRALAQKAVTYIMWHAWEPFSVTYFGSLVVH